MAVDMFLKLGDIKGESRDQAHRDEIDVTEWAWGLSQTGSMHSGTGAESQDEVLYDSIALNFASVDVSYQPQKADGAKDGGPVKFGWNIRQNVKV